MYLIVSFTRQCEWQSILALLEGAGGSIADQQPFEEWCTAALENESSETGKDVSSSRLDAELKNSASELLNKMPSPAIFPVYNSRYLPVLQHWLNEFPDGNMLLFFSRPEPILVEAMEQHKDPGEVLRQWRETAEMLMNAYRWNISRSLLADAQEVISDPELLFHACEERFGLSFKLKDINHAGKASPREIHKFFASQFVRQTPGLPELLGGFDANSLSLRSANTISAVDCAEAYRDYERIRIGYIENKLKNLERENELLILQLHQAREELETCSPEHYDSDKIRRFKQSISWRVTAPMRRLAAFFRKILRKLGIKTGIRRIINRMLSFR